MYIPVIEGIVLISVSAETCQSCPAVFSALNYRARVNVKLVSIVSRCVHCEWGGCLYVAGQRKHTVKVLCCFEEAYRGETSSFDIPKGRRELSKSKEAPVRAETLKRGDEDRFTCNKGHCWHDIKCPSHLSTLLNMSHVTSTIDKRPSKWNGRLIDWILKIIKAHNVAQKSQRCMFFLLLCNKPCVHKW